MSELDLTVLAASKDDDQNNTNQSTPMQEINLALKECGFGWFHLKLLIASFFGFSVSVFITNTSPYILPNAECDLHMNLLMKGVLSASPYLGMILSSIVAGFLTDTFGRKIFLVGGYALMAFFNVVSGMSQTYSILVASKVCEGFVFAVAFSPTMTFTSELCHSEIRDRVMILQSSFASTNHILLAGMSWAILMNDWKYTLFDGHLVLNTWNFYLLIMTAFSLISCILYSFLPESPKYLVAQQRYDEAREILVYIYKMNTGKPADTFKYYNLWQGGTAKLKDKKSEAKTTLSQQLTLGFHNIKPLFKKPYLYYLLLFSTMYFLIMLLYNVIRMWYPQLSTIVEHYASEDNQELCVMLDAYTHDQSLKSVNTTAMENCVPVKSGSETYINSIILGCICVTPYLFSGLLVNKVGKKSLIIFAGLITVGATLGLRWSRSKTQVVALFSTDMAVAQIMMSLMQATTVEFFPTTTRTLAIALTMTSGRIGSLFGNIMFPILLNMSCVVPFFTIAGLMACVTALAIILPNAKK